MDSPKVLGYSGFTGAAGPIGYSGFFDAIGTVNYDTRINNMNTDTGAIMCGTSNTITVAAENIRYLNPLETMTVINGASPSINTPNNNSVKDTWKIIAGTDSEGEEENSCKICLENEVKCIVMPCMHASMCILCVNKFKRNDPCPICRTPMTERSRFYKS
jgi:hypothetical protein